MKSIDDRITSAIQNNDLGELEALEQQLFQKSEQTNRPFAPALELKAKVQKELHDLPDAGAFDKAGRGLKDIAIALANRISRAKRLIKFNIKTAGDFAGLVIVSEGDSWFQYPAILDDIIDNLAADDDKAILSLGRSGDVLSSIAEKKEYVGAINEYQADVFMLSGGGNDIFGEGQFEGLLLQYSQGADPQSLINQDALLRVLGNAKENYHQILADIFSIDADILVFGHAYDGALPRDEGDWLGRPLQAKNIPFELGEKIIALIMKEFADILQSLSREYPNFHFVDLFGAVGTSLNSWFDELHPKNAGFERIANRFREAIDTHAGLTESTLDAQQVRAPTTNLADEFHDDDAPLDIQMPQMSTATHEDVPITSSFAQRTRMANKIVDFEGKRDKQGHLVIHRLRSDDGGGRYEVAGINERYHRQEADYLVGLIQAGRHEEAEQYATEFIATYSDPADRWCTTAAVEFYLRDCIFNRGPGGAAWIVQHAVGVATDRVVGSRTRAAIAQAEQSPGQFLDRLRASRETYERRKRDESSAFWRGLVNRWNNAKAFALTFLSGEDTLLFQARAQKQPIPIENMEGANRILNCKISPNPKDDWKIDAAHQADVIRAANYPEEVDLRESWWPIGNQGDTGSCVGWATADSLLRWHFVKRGHLKKDEQLSIRFIWVAAKETDAFNKKPTTFIEESGTSLKAALDVARKLGNVKSEILPFDRSQVFTGKETGFYARAAQLRINSYINLDRDLSAWRLWLYQNGPILTRLDIDQNFRNATAANSRLEHYDLNSRLGGHAVALVGYTAQGFIVRNSWSTIWGDGGFALATDAYAQAAFTEAYGVTV